MVQQTVLLLAHAQIGDGEQLPDLALKRMLQNHAAFLGEGAQTLQFNNRSGAVASHQQLLAQSVTRAQFLAQVQLAQQHLPVVCGALVGLARIGLEILFPINGREQRRHFAGAFRTWVGIAGQQQASGYQENEVLQLADLHCGLS